MRNRRSKVNTFHVSALSILLMPKPEGKRGLPDVSPLSPAITHEQNGSQVEDPGSHPLLSAVHRDDPPCCCSQVQWSCATAISCGATTPSAAPTKPPRRPIDKNVFSAAVSSIVLSHLLFESELNALARASYERNSRVPSGHATLCHGVLLLPDLCLHCPSFVSVWYRPPRA